jgi:hypothetical protein
MSESLTPVSDCGCSACIPITLNQGGGGGADLMVRVPADWPATGAFDGQEYRVVSDSVPGHKWGERGYWDDVLKVWVVEATQ